MKINLYAPDSKIPNLALMKISAWHKLNGDSTELNMPLMPCDMSYASVLFNWTPIPNADIIGGTGYDININLEPEMENMKPDYDLYPDMRYSMGYTYKACPRTCEFCVVPKQNNTTDHYSIWNFHDTRFNEICLLNNNTLADLRWRDTFQEIVDANLTVIDQNGYDARLITEEAAMWLGKIKFKEFIHLAWDFMEHELQILLGIKNLIQYIKPYKIVVYVLIGNNTTPEEDMHRIVTLHDMGVNPFVMPLDKSNAYQKRLARWVNHKAIFKSVKWEEYKG